MVPVPCKIRHNLNFNDLGMHRWDRGDINMFIFGSQTKYKERITGESTEVTLSEGSSTINVN